jgi:hypothetical protein
MIRFALGLTVRGGRAAAVRLAVTAAAVAIGVGLLLMTLAGINAVNAQNDRYAWLETSSSGSNAPTASGHGIASGSHAQSAHTTAADPLWWLLVSDTYRGQLLGRVEVAATGPHSPVPPGIPRLPGPGQFYASPALQTLLRTVPAAQLADRFPGHEVGTIGKDALPAPNSLLIVVGRTVAQLSHASGAVQVAAIATTNPGDCIGDCVTIGINPNGLDLILAVAAGALIFPVLIFIATATRLSATGREQRYAALRLVGATPRQVAVVSAVESCVAAILGMIAGFGVFFLLRPAVAHIPFTGAPFFVNDLSLNLADVSLVALGVPIAAAVAARIALRRVSISPLGTMRRTTPRPPTAWRLIPLAAGLGELAYFVAAGNPPTSTDQVAAYLPGFILVMIGLVTSGPWLTMLGSRLIARRTRRPAVLIAGRRLGDNPQAGFRAISGVVVGLFVATTAVALITSFTSNRGGMVTGAASRDTLEQQFDRRIDSASSDQSVTIPSVSALVLRQLAAIPGVEEVTEVHTDPNIDPLTYPGWLPALVACAQLRHTPALGHCPAGAAVASIDGNYFVRRNPQPTRMVGVSLSQLHGFPAQGLVVTADSAASIERARTRLELTYPNQEFPTTVAENSRFATGGTTEYQQLANVVILVSLPIAGCSLAASVAGGVSERKRPFSLLRLTGVPVTLLRRVVVLESAVPLLVAATVSIGAGFAASQLFLASQLGYSVQAPGLEYYLVVLAGLLASLGVITATLPILQRVTGPETARND